MQITVSGHHVEVTSSLREYVESKLQRLERRLTANAAAVAPLPRSVPRGATRAGRRLQAWRFIRRFLLDRPQAFR